VKVIVAPRKLIVFFPVIDGLYVTRHFDDVLSSPAAFTRSLAAGMEMAPSETASPSPFAPGERHQTAYYAGTLLWEWRALA
jgi:hypothetical protein